MSKIKNSHCARVPQNYKSVSRILKKVIEDGIGLKDVVYGNNNNYDRNKQRNFALATNILSRYRKIEHILSTTKLLESEPKLDAWLARVLIHELVWRKDLNYACTPVQVVISYKKQINDALSVYEEDPADQPVKKVYKPKYVRVNTLKMSVSDVINQLRNEGMTLIPSQQETYAEYLECISEIPEYHFMIDYHIKEILVFEPGFAFINHNLYQNGTLIIQDKASCLAPYLLAPHEGASVLDMCAAPGMKSNYLANLVGKKGHVYAVEKHEGRFYTLSNLMKTQGMKNIHCIHQDATNITGADLTDVEYILVDPSCSGSGIVNRVEYEKSKPGRLRKLADFQEIILRHALTKFRNVKRVTYSTCSLYPEENEEVIRAVLKYNPSFQLVNLKEKLGSNWHHYGSEKYENVGPFCMYTNPEKDLTNGFFIAVFEKKFRNRGGDELPEINHENVEEVMEINKKKKQSNTEITEDQNEMHQEEIYEEKNKKKRKHREEFLVEIQEISEEIQEKKKKNKTITEENSTELNELQETVTEEICEEKNKKKRKHRGEFLIETQEISEEIQEKKKKIKTITEENSTELNEVQETVTEEICEEKNKKKRKHRGEFLLETQEISEEIQEKKKKIKTITEENSTELNEVQETGNKEITKKKKKRKKDKLRNEENYDNNVQNEITDEVPSKKKKNKKLVNEENTETIENNTENVFIDEISVKRKKKKKHIYEETETVENNIQNVITEEHSVKKKKKRTDKENTETRGNNLENIIIDEEPVKKKKKKKHINNENIEAVEDINKEYNFQDHNTEKSLVDSTKKVKKKKSRVQEDN